MIDKTSTSLIQSYILYTDQQDFVVSVRYKTCQVNKKCNCGLYLKTNNTVSKYAFIDFCDQSTMNYNRLTMKYFEPKTKFLSSLNCYNYIEDEYNDKEWSKIPTSFNSYKCARVKGECERYIVRK